MADHSINDELATIADALRRSTVQIQGHRGSLGSGVIWNTDGLIITNAHVVRGRRAIAQLADDRSFEARVIASDPQRDLAALIINAKNLPPVTVRHTHDLQLGELVVAVGNPLGLVGVLTTGIVHTVPAGSAKRRSWIQADIRLAPGNSGGPLADAQGRVLGINSMIVNGRAFAIPSQTVERFLGSQDSRPYLGVTLQPVVLPLHQQRIFGWLILELAAKSPAASSGLLPGDVVIGIDDQLFQAPDELAFTIGEANPGDRLQLNIIRSGQQITMIIEIGNKRSGAEAA